MRLFDMTWNEVAALDRNIVTLLPFGAVEQHSFHLPTGTDAILAEAVAQGLEERLPDHVLLLPVTWLGCSRHHMDFPGSLSASLETFMNTGTEIAESLMEHGFRRFFLLNAHGGNACAISLLVERLCRRREKPPRVVGATYWRLISEEMKQIRDTPLGGMGHACEFETSLMMAVRPHLVRRDRIEADGPAHLSEFESKDMFDAGAVTTGKTFKELSGHGGIGDPTRASAEKGQRILELVLTKLVRIVHELQQGTI